MGSIISTVLSTLQDTIFTVVSILKALNTLNEQYQSLLRRVASPPGLPVPNLTSSFWLVDPPFPHLTSIQQDLPAEADIIIIGSGITAASIAKTILELSPTPPRVVVCEARDICSGATGRNGGHIKCVPYDVFATFKAKFGGIRAREIVNFQRLHLPRLLEVGMAVPEGEVRMVQTVDLFLLKEDFEKAKQQVKDALAWLIEGCEIWDAAEARKKVRENGLG